MTNFRQKIFVGIELGQEKIVDSGKLIVDRE